MTANFLEGDQKDNLIAHTGADGFVKKPFPALDEFQLLLEKAIARRKEHTSGDSAAPLTPLS
jgi:hypothetical protein